MKSLLGHMLPWTSHILCTGILQW